ncbi:hypothetical protein ACIGD1_11460 [Streptomyces sp. NPDC085612]|uniref:hypothetical protein n=1 Tax=Streptomyces sp. NPDC085612 TaxID=3365732 RepID=UPI0037D18081
MPVSGRRHRALTEDNARLLEENGRLLRDLATATAKLEARDELIQTLSARPQAQPVKPLGVGYVPAADLRASESARAILVDRLELLQNANMSLREVAA